jgi:hypothetical protein
MDSTNEGDQMEGDGEGREGTLRALNYKVSKERHALGSIIAQA